MPLPLTTISAATSRKILLLPIFPPPLSRGRGLRVLTLRDQARDRLLHLRLLPLLLSLLLQLLLLFLLGQPPPLSPPHPLHLFRRLESPFPGGSEPRSRRWRRRQPTTAKRGEEHQRQPRNRPWLLAPAAPAPSGRRAAKNWLSSVPVGRSSSLAPHHGWDEGLQPVPSSRSAARVSTTSAAVAAAFERLPLRRQVQHWSTS